MGMIGNVLGVLFGRGRNIVAETAEVFLPNAEAQSKRQAAMQAAALAQMAAEFGRPSRGWFDAFMDGLNRVPRPALALGTLALFVAAMWDPIWFGERMTGLALVPDQMWWLLGAIVTFYFGARHQAKMQAHHDNIATTLARAPQVVEALSELRELRPDSVGAARTRSANETLAVTSEMQNAAIEEWRRGGGLGS